MCCSGQNLKLGARVCDMTCMQRSAPILGHGRGLQGQNRTPKMFSPDLGNERPCILPSAANPIQFRYILGKTHSQGSIHLIPHAATHVGCVHSGFAHALACCACSCISTTMPNTLNRVNERTHRHGRTVNGHRICPDHSAPACAPP